MFESSWSQEKRQKAKYDFVVYYNEELERYVPVYDPNRVPEFLDALQPGLGFVSPEKKKLYETLLAQGEAYASEKHEGHLRCPDGCNAHIKYREAGEEENSKFKLDKEGEQSKHKGDCKFKSKPKPRRIDIDATQSRGVIEGQFNSRADNHISNRIHHALTSGDYQDLVGRKIKQAASAEDFIKIFKKGDLKKDIFVDQHQVIKGKDFFLLDAKDIKRLYEEIEYSSETRFRAMKFTVHKSSDEIRPNEHKSVTGQKIFFKRFKEDRPEDDVVHYIVPRLMPVPEGSENARECIPEDGAYMIIGDFKKGDTIPNGNVVIHYMDIHIRNPAQVAKWDQATIKPDRSGNNAARVARLEP